jgi:hypothetical protein
MPRIAGGGPAFVLYCGRLPEALEVVMTIANKLAAILFGLAALSGAAVAATIGGTYYAVQYDFAEFFAATDGKPFRVVLAGQAFPNVAADTVARDLLPIMQAAKPRPALTFTYDVPVEKPRPDYRLMLLFNPANDLGPDSVCQGVTRFKPGQPGLFYVYAVYCRNDMAMSTTTAWTQATGPTDPRIGQLFRELFQVVFSDSPALLPQFDRRLRRW